MENAAPKSKKLPLVLCLTAFLYLLVVAKDFQQLGGVRVDMVGWGEYATRFDWSYLPRALVVDVWLLILIVPVALILSAMWAEMRGRS